MSVWKDHNTYRFRVQRQGRVITGAARSFEEAKELEARALLDLHAGRVGRQVERSLEAALLHYLDSSEFQDLKSKKQTESHLRALLPYVERRPLTQIVEAAEAARKAMRKAGLEPATIYQRLSILRRVANLAFSRWGWLDIPLAKKIAMPSVKNERHIYLEPDEAIALINACRHEEAAAAITLAVYTALRANQIFKLRPSNIRGNSIILDAKTKNDRPLMIPILPQAKEAVQRVPLQITYRNTIKYFWEARITIGRPEIHFHDLRHTLASWLAQSGAELTDIRDWLGHKNIATTNRYAHLSGKRLRAVARKLKR